MIFFAAIAILSSMLIYRYLFSSVWSDEKKKAYLQELKNGEVDFKLNNFNLVIEKSKEREALYNEGTVENVRDIFDIKK